ncbi:putative flavoprotein [Parasitella parasitica]|nr:putative flavoprotein [Parasitella parasitica]
MNQTQPTVAVIGTGFSGLCAAIQVKKQLGIKAQLYEISADVGGTWHDNTYPGCACDIPSPLYSFSFELNPDWSHHYSPQSEIYKYLRKVARKHGIYEQTKFRTEVVCIQWIQEKQMWKVESRRSADVNLPQPIVAEYFNYVFAGLGPLRIPNIPPQFKGFTGKVVHTALWDSSIDLSEKNVAVVGSGASAIQAIPELRKVAKHLTSYQRTPAWIAPRDQFAYSGITKFLLQHVPFLMRIFRNAIFFQHELYYAGFGFHGTLISRAVHRIFEKLTAFRLKRAGRADLIPVLTPTFPPGCKRIAKSENYLEALAKPNVTVVPRAVKEAQGDILTDIKGNTQQVDVLVLATGFNVEGFLGNLEIYGRDNLSLRDRWEKHYPDTYKGATIHGFPNFFLLLGAGVGLGHNSVVTIIECQVQYAIRCMKHAIKKNLAALEPKLAAQDAYTAKLKRQFTGTVWKSGCSSWYLNKDGDVYGLWPNTVTNFWLQTLNPGFKNFIEHKRN